MCYMLEADIYNVSGLPQFPYESAQLLAKHIFPLNNSEYLLLLMEISLLSYNPGLFFYNVLESLRKKEYVITDLVQSCITMNLKFKKELNECKTLADKWIYFIKNVESLDVIPPDVTDEGLKEAYTESDKHNWTKEELNNYDYFLMREQDERGKVELAERRAEEKAKKSNTSEIAKNFKSIGVDLRSISKATALSIEEIEKL